MSINYYPGYSQTFVSPNLTTHKIASITNACPCVVTTVFNNHYVPGMNVTFLIPQQFGMQQLTNLVVQVLAVSGTSISLNLDSTNFTPFAYPLNLPFSYTPPSVIPSSSGVQLPPQFLPYGNENGFEGAIFNEGMPSNPIR